MIKVMPCLSQSQLYFSDDSNMTRWLHPVDSRSSDFM